MNLIQVMHHQAIKEEVSATLKQQMLILIKNAKEMVALDLLFEDIETKVATAPFKSQIWMNSQQEGICLRRRKNVKASKMEDFFASEMASKKQ